MTDTTLFGPYTLGALKLSNRIVMAPLTRNRAGAGLVPSAHAATRYSQSASAGLVITVATQISADDQGYRDAPGLYTPAQGKADLFTFRRPFIGDPDLVERLKTGEPLAALNPATLDGGGAAGYIDYPALASAAH